MSVERITRKVEQRLADYRFAKKTLSVEQKNLKSARRRVRDTKKAVVTLQTVAQQVQQEAHAKISSVVTRCLAAVFERPYTFQVTFERKRNKTEARITFLRDELEVEPGDGTGGGVLDVAAFALRLAALILSRPKRRRLLVLDEPFKFVSKSKGYRDRVRDLINTLSDEMGVQFIIVTHQDELRVGSVIDLEE